MRLPETWSEVRLDQVSSIGSGDGAPQEDALFEAGQMPFVRTQDVSAQRRGPYLHATKDSVNNLAFEKHRLRVWPKNSLLIPKSGASALLNNRALLGMDACVVSHLAIVTPNNEILPEYLYHWSLVFDSQRVIPDQSYPSIRLQDLARIRLPLPTLPEQQRIVEVLRQAEDVESRRSQQVRDIGRIAHERFYDLFGHPAENALGFEVVSLTGLGEFDRGVSKHRPRDAAHLFGGPYPFIQTGDVTNAGDWITKYSTTYSEVGLAQSRLWPKGTLCITIAANIARAAILDFDACFPDSVVGFTPHAGVHTEYVLYCLRFYQEFFEHRAPKSAQMNINLEKLRALRVPKPPESLQRKFAEFVREIRAVTNLLGPQQEDMTTLTRQLQLAALSGELTEGWRERYRYEVEEADAQRKAALGEGGKRVSVAITERAPAERETYLAPPARTWLIDQLSEFQNSVRLALYEWKGTVMPDDSEAFDDFCRQWPIEHEQNPKDRTRRTLEQLAALGLVSKVSLRNDSGEFVTGFRPLREDESTRLVDAERVNAALATRNPSAGSW